MISGTIMNRLIIFLILVHLLDNCRTFLNVLLVFLAAKANTKNSCKSESNYNAASCNLLEEFTALFLLFGFRSIAIINFLSLSRCFLDSFFVGSFFLFAASAICAICYLGGCNTSCNTGRNASCSFCRIAIRAIIFSSVIFTLIFTTFFGVVGTALFSRVIFGAISFSSSLSTLSTRISLLFVGRIQSIN